MAGPATRTTTQPAPLPRRPRRPGGGDKADRPEAEDKQVEGTIELLGNGSAFVRLADGETSDEDVYVSAAQVKRCELVSGDKVAGPMRPPRRSERFPSLVRVDTINGKPADEVSEGTRFEDLPVIFPAERLALGTEDPTVKAIEWLTPFGKGSRVTHRRPGARRQDRGAAADRRRARRAGRRRAERRARGRPPRGGRRVAGRPDRPGHRRELRRVVRRPGPGRRAGGRAGAAGSPRAAPTPS